MRTSLAERMAADGYDGYAYAYPHKTAYRTLDPPVPLESAWRDEDRRSLFLYVHLPFCEMRCGFCNLFTTVRPGEEFIQRTLAAIRRQSAVVAGAVGAAGIAQAALGGGTPTMLSEEQLEDLFAGLATDWPVQWEAIPVSVEASPGTVSAGKLALLRALGIRRLSLGVQSFVEEDLRAMRRPEAVDLALRACELIRAAGFPVFNLDLIYGSEGQDAARWQASLERALEWRPEELYLYPLYIGPLTRLDHLGRRPGERRRALYRQARDLLRAAGYRQVSMRLFRRSDVNVASDYCCQEDGMVGLGPGARSYTRDLHYSTEYAVGLPGVRRIVEDFAGRDEARFAFADHGARLDMGEQRIRFVLKSLLRVDGVRIEEYRRRFGGSFWEDFAQARELVDLGLARAEPDRLALTDEGLAWSDTIGPWLYSDAVQAQMAACALR